jgi:hypothetical protein
MYCVEKFLKSIAMHGHKPINLPNVMILAGHYTFDLAILGLGT